MVFLNNASRNTHLRPYSSSNTNAIINAAAEPPPPTQSHPNGSLAGKSIAIKDNILTTATPTTAASRALHNYPSPFPATVITLLQQHGAYISSKTNLDEFGMGSHTQSSFHGPAISPFSRNGVPLTPGGSSGGSAVAVAEGKAWAALGTDTGGSVRLPAAYCGVVGFKPSYGCVSRWGVVAYANSMDTVGVLARTVGDARKVFGVLDVYDERDPTSLLPSVRQRIRSKRSSTAGRGKKMRIGVPTSYLTTSISPAVRAAYASTLTRLQAAGHTLIPIGLPTSKLALSTYYILAPAEASSNLAKYDGIRYGYRTSGPDARPKEDPPLPFYAATRGEAFGDEVRRRILLGAYTLSSEAMHNYFIQAQKIRRLVSRDFDAVFALPHPLHEDTAQRPAPLPSDENKEDGKGKVDIILTPTTPTLPPTLSEIAQQSALEHYMNDVFTVPASLACLPALSVPVPLPAEVREGMEEGDVSTVGVQVIGQLGDDEGVLGAGEVVEGLW
ncbi:Trimeric GatFAB AmidoTransferase(AdT) complex subunit [Saxophila tyrrhenica]|uniref:Glutamyl-tRNA(Gln) amidotransferase subunit A, mitochondrial n=1 Tax=Saxophila tyrrhenica TaxID=1690608 RepID=A0AAV9P871_9PEZI|nr:Trimeric GatFAB AmidoTransferase(AdT) complex subunit [Saxophila tyrrhenica]